MYTPKQVSLTVAFFKNEWTKNGSAYSYSSRERCKSYQEVFSTALSSPPSIFHSLWWAHICDKLERLGILLTSSDFANYRDKMDKASEKQQFLQTVFMTLAKEGLSQKLEDYL